MKITVLTGLEHEGGSLDPVVDQVLAALRESGHEASVLAIHTDVREIIDGLREAKPDLVFNLLEMFGDDIRGDVGVAGLLDLLGVPYTGGGPGEFYLRQDKALAKKLLAFEDILYPDFAVFSPGRRLRDRRQPAHAAVRQAAAAGRLDRHRRRSRWSATPPQMMERVLAIHEKFNDAALAEEYIEGREFYVGVLGNREPDRLPADRDGLLGPAGREPRGRSTARRSGRRRAPSTRARSRSWPTCRTSCAPGCRRSRSTPTAPCACATTAASTCG